MENALAKANAAVAKFDQDYVNERNAKNEPIDFGTCGMAIVLLEFGRKRKLKTAAIEAGLISEKRIWDVGSRKAYVALVNRGKVPTQNIDYYVKSARVAVDVLREELEPLGVDVSIHSWVD